VRLEVFGDVAELTVPRLAETADERFFEEPIDGQA
jgi:hypothetical protein